MRSGSMLLLAASISLVSAWAGPARAATPSKTQLAQALSGYEDVPPASAWRAWGPGTLAVLVELYDDDAQPRFVRLRAVRAAAHYRTPATRTFLLAVAQAPGQLDLFVRAAIVSLGRAFGEGALDDVAPFLAHAAPAVREGAVIALSRIESPAAKAALSAHLPSEMTRHISDRIRRAIAEPPASGASTAQTSPTSTAR